MRTAGCVGLVGLAVTAGGLAPSIAAAAPVLRAAEVRITITSPVSCQVTMSLTIESGGEIDHRVDAIDVALIDVRGARQVGALRTIGRTQSLVLQPEEASYQFSYRVRQPDDRARRCPIWLPTVPTDGRSKAVRIRVELPSGAVPGSSMPAFMWTGGRGVTTLGHLPALVRVSYGAEGEARRWDIGRMMDEATAAVLVGASLFWMWRRKR